MKNTDWPFLYEINTDKTILYTQVYYQNKYIKIGTNYHIVLESRSQNYLIHFLYFLNMNDIKTNNKLITHLELK